MHLSIICISYAGISVALWSTFLFNDKAYLHPM